MLFTLQRAELVKVTGFTSTLKREQHTRKIFVGVAGTSPLGRVFDIFG